MTSALPKLVLAAEDEETDAFFLRLAFERAGLGNPLVIVRDGQEAVDYLSGVGAYADRSAHPLPGLVVLDLKMPRMDGFEVLTWLFQRAELSHVPAIVLSSSPDQSDIRRAKAAGAREYFVKPHNFRELMEIVETMRIRWLALAPE